MLVGGQNKAADLSSLFMIHSIATAFKSLLRPSDLSFHDKVPAERLPQVITENNITDVDKVFNFNFQMAKRWFFLTQSNQA